jgi:hypothetical protein
MPLQNRVDPFGELFASEARGTLFGNRGGKFHRDDKTLSTRRWATRQWICCVLEFKGRRRNVWGRYYTELFFLDEVTALAAGHRPCFECRRADAVAFAEAFGARGTRPSAPEMDAVLQAERLDGRRKRVHRRAIDALPDGAFITLAGSEALAVKGHLMLPWTPFGYGPPRPRLKRLEVEVLTPPSMLRALSRGYRPAWHATCARPVGALQD